MSGSVLTHRSNRASGLFSDGNNNVVVKSVPVKGPQDGLSSRRIINEEDDTATVKSNPNGSPSPSSTQSSSRRYVLPCFRIRRTKQSALSLSSLPSGNFLPPPKQWGAGRESRIQARKQRRASLSTAASEEDPGIKEDDSVQYSDYEAHLLNFIFNIRAEGVKFNLLSLREPDPPGQEMGFYTQLGFLKQLRLTLGNVGPANIDDGEFRLVEVVNLAEEGTDSEYSAARVRNRIYPPLMKAQNGATGYGGGPPDVVIDAYGSMKNQKPYPVIVRAVRGEMSFPDYRDPDGKEIEAGGAFGMAGHIASSWAIAFNMASSALWHCASKRPSHPHPKAKRRMYNRAHCDNGIDSPCMFSFLAGSKGTTARPSAIASTLLPFIVQNTGWQPGTDMDAGFARKGGLIGTGTGATLTLLFRNVTRPVRRFDVVSLRSTSHVWNEGAAKFVLVTGGDFSHGKEAAEASSKNAREVSFEISAELNAEVSNGEDQHVSYHFGLDLDYAETNESVGKDLLLRITLTKGSKFKILGLMLCE
ncbi:hypothetical protein QTG54_012634 [Skeletonema marinoi]|uniref:Uncharacterized protein n=1 Tax=Skeletonema marinoi TaxID=267567 RepID=A0AAD8Y067_9STRA|nr:hypothetical protein QTG54_012634 [Skeletonema marinoi]